MQEERADQLFVFPKWANYLLPAAALAVIGGLFYVTTLFGLGASPKTLAAGYSPIQPVPYSHALHVGKLGLDCRYCHTSVENAAFAALPPTQTCMNCHTNIKNDSPLLQPIRDSWTSGQPMEWVKIHNLPNYVYFNHSAHVDHGVGCIECHGRIDEMDRVYQVKPLSMGWCLECHRDPGAHLRPRDVAVTDMQWPIAAGGDRSPSEDPEMAAKLVADYGIHDRQYMISCSTCHR